MIGLGERIKAAADEVGGLDHLAPKLTGISRRTLSDWANDKTEPRASSLVEISEITGVSLIWLLNGGTARFPSKEPGGSVRIVTSPASRDNSGMIRLPVYSEVRASAGPGAVATSEQADGFLSFEPRFLLDLGANPEWCILIWAHGDSMVPTIPDGAALIVDRSQTEVKNGSIMVISVGDDLLVKRIRRRLDGLIDLISDNPAYAAETLGPAALQQLRVVGRVVYFCRTP